jgi:hypothetical protein
VARPKAGAVKHGKKQVDKTARERVHDRELAERIARARVKSPPQDPTGACHCALAEIAQRCGRDVGDLVDEWHERAAVREYLGGVTRDEAERLAVADVGSAYAPTMFGGP